MGQDDRTGIRVFLEDSEGNPTSYFIPSYTPGTTFSLELYDVPKLMTEAGLNWGEVALSLYEWSKKTRGVVKTTVSYTGKNFAVTVLIDFDKVDDIAIISNGMRECLPEDFQAIRPHYCVLGPEEANSPILNAIDNIEVYSDTTNYHQSHAA
jgi:hypothetical protein